MSFWTIHNRDCRELCDHYPQPTFKATVTSPPYKEGEGYSLDLLEMVARALLDATHDGGFAFINIAHLAEEWRRPFEVYDSFARAGWRPRTTIIWVKSMVFPPLGPLADDVADMLQSIEDGESLREAFDDYHGACHLVARIEAMRALNRPHQIGHYTPIQAEGRLNNLFEYIFVFSKGDASFDKLTPPNGVEYTDKGNLTRGNRGKNGDRHDSGNVWFIPYRTTGNKDKKRHVYEYPEELVERCIRLAGCKPGDTILDPFAGSGTTLAVAKRLGISAVGYEIDATMAQKAAQNLELIEVPS